MFSRSFDISAMTRDSGPSTTMPLTAGRGGERFVLGRALDRFRIGRDQHDPQAAVFDDRFLRLEPLAVHDRDRLHARAARAGPLTCARPVSSVVAVRVLPSTMNSTVCSGERSCRSPPRTTRTDTVPAGISDVGSSDAGHLLRSSASRPARDGGATRQRATSSTTSASAITTPRAGCTSSLRSSCRTARRRRSPLPHLRDSAGVARRRRAARRPGSASRRRARGPASARSRARAAAATISAKSASLTFPIALVELEFLDRPQHERLLALELFALAVRRERRDSAPCAEEARDGLRAARRPTSPAQIDRRAEQQQRGRMRVARHHDRGRRAGHREQQEEVPGLKAGARRRLAAAQSRSRSSSSSLLSRSASAAGCSRRRAPRRPRRRDQRSGHAADDHDAQQRRRRTAAARRAG